MNLSRILGCVGAFTLGVVACNDKDVSLITPDAGNGGTSSTAGSGGSSSTAGSAGSSSTAGTGGGGGSAGSSNAGSGGMSGSAGSSATDPDGGTDSGTPGPYAALCESYCAARAAWATATTDAGVNCPGYDSSTCQDLCETEIAGLVNNSGCTDTAPAAYACYTSANTWYCLDNNVYTNNCEGSYCINASCDPTCDPEARALNTCLFTMPICTAP